MDTQSTKSVGAVTQEENTDEDTGSIKENKLEET
jgi:hypothetical protein